MPQGLVTKNFLKLDAAFSKGYTTASEQGSSRSSKTYSNIQWLIKLCWDMAGMTVSVVRKTMPALKRSVYRDFEEIMIDWGLWGLGSMNKSEFVYRFPNGSWIEFFSCEDEQKLRGSKRHILFVNEANEISFLEWQQLQMRTTLFSIIDYNPSFSDEHWINQVNQEKKTCHWISTYKDNPFLEQKVIDEIESLQWKNKSLWQVYGLGQRAIVEGLVFPNVNVIDYVPWQAEKHRYVGVDYGYEHDPTAIIEVGFYKNGLYLNELCYKTHMLTSDIIRELKGIEWEPEIISESADPRMVDEIYNAGLDIRPVHKFGGSIMAGITKMQEYNIYITKGSVNLIKEFNNYTYRQDKEGKWLNEPIDAYNHCFVGETLISTAKGLKRIDKVEVGELVVTSNGFNKITKFFNNGRQKVLEVRLFFNNFRVNIEATPNHLFKTKEGWKRLDELKPNDTLYLNRSLMEKYITSIEESDTTQKAQEDYIEWYGNTITERYQKDIISTIETGTQKTMPSKISKWYKGENTYIVTQKKIYNQKSILGKLVKIWQKLLQQLKNGIILRKGENGIENTAGKLPLTSSQSSLFANNVENISFPNHQDSIDSAPINVKQNGVEIITSMRKCEFASNAEKNSLSTNTVRVNFAEEVVLEDIIVINESYKEVYDIEVEGVHEFFANGILVHNCIDAIRYVVLEKILGANASGMSASEILGIL